VPVELFGESWVLFRDEVGGASCVYDECAHRACPLSLGTIEDGQVRLASASCVTVCLRRLRAPRVPALARHRRVRPDAAGLCFVCFCAALLCSTIRFHRCS
jgi:Rieske [2Fe-2S] domain